MHLIMMMLHYVVSQKNYLNRLGREVYTEDEHIYIGWLHHYDGCNSFCFTLEILQMNISLIPIMTYTTPDCCYAFYLWITMCACSFFYAVILRIMSTCIEGIKLIDIAIYSLLIMNLYFTQILADGSAMASTAWASRLQGLQKLLRSHSYVRVNMPCWTERSMTCLHPSRLWWHANILSHSMCCLVS